MLSAEKRLDPLCSTAQSSLTALRLELFIELFIYCCVSVLSSV